MAMADEFDKASLVGAFKKAHDEHYDVGRDLGEGAAGFTFLAHDKRRRVDVCVKLLKSGTASEGSRRDWKITSTIKHPMVGDTFTVEHFTIDGSGAPCAAIVSRYIEGKSLADFLDGLGLLDLKHRVAAERDLAGLGVGLCNAVATIHAFNVGHGDLHERNVKRARNASTPVTTASTRACR
jgi:serine/threonine protein kinase